MGTELFTNNTATTVSSGGTTAPASGTVETWTVASSASFPAASSTLGTQFHVADPGQPTEKIKVTNVSGPTWTVTRGAEGTTPVAHTTGFTVVQVVTAGALAAFRQAKPWQFFVDDPAYGAVGDGKIVADVSTTNGSAVITSASANFVTADVGKSIMINGANGTTSTPLITTILSRQSATQVTLNANAGATATNCQAVYGTDDTTAINNAVTAAGDYAKANQFFAEVVFGAKTYMLTSGPTQTGNGTSTPTFNSQIPLPHPNANGTTQKLVIALTGAGDAGFVQYWQSTTPNVAGTALVSTTTAPSTPHATFGIQSVIGGPSGSAGFTGGYANTKAVVKGIEVVCPIYTNQYAYDFAYLSACHVDAASAHIFALAGVGGGTGPLIKDLPPQAAFQSTIGVGLRTPVTGNNADCTVSSFTVEGYARGLYIFDHFTAGRIFTFYTDVGIRLDTTLGVSGTMHAISILNWGCEATNGGLLVTGNAQRVPVNITMASETVAPVYDVSDVGNNLYGILHWVDPVNNRTPGVIGAANLKFVNDRMGPGQWAGAPAVPASTTPQQNTSWRDAAVVVTGGTVSAVSVDGVAQGYTASGFTVIVPAGKNVTLTYSVAPTWKWTLL